MDTVRIWSEKPSILSCSPIDVCSHELWIRIDDLSTLWAPGVQDSDVALLAKVSFRSELNENECNNAVSSGAFFPDMPPLWTELTDSLSYKKHVAQWNSTSGTCSDSHHIFLTYGDIEGLDSVVFRAQGYRSVADAPAVVLPVQVKIFAHGLCPDIPIE